MVSVGATENVLMAATLAEGTTISGRDLADCVVDYLAFAGSGAANSPEFRIDEGMSAKILIADDERRSAGILAFRTPANELVDAALKQAGVTSGLREGAIRLAPHFYNVEDDLAPVLEVLNAVEGRGWR